MAKRNQGSRRVGTTIIVLLIVSIGLFAGLVALEVPNVIIRFSFSQVLTAIANHHRYQRPIPQALPPINSLGWTGYSGGHWWHNGSIDWQQVRDYTSDMVYLNHNASWCEYFIITAQPDHQFHWLIWYEQYPGSYSFLFYLPDDNAPAIAATYQFIYLILFVALVSTLTFLGAHIALMLHTRSQADKTPEPTPD
jgi:hypothetical protein